MDPLRILLVISSSKVGGAERHTAQLACGLTMQGNAVQVVCPPGEWLGDHLKEKGIRTLEVSMAPLSLLTRQHAINQLIHEFRPHIIHSHLTGAAYQAALASVRHRIPLIASVHNLTSHGYKPISEDAKKPDIQLTRYLQTGYTDWIFRYVANHGATLVAVSKFVEDHLVADGIRKQQIRVIYNGVDFADQEAPLPDESVREEFNIPKDANLVGIIARICRQKGQLLALEAVSRMKPELKKNLYLILAGKLDPAFEPEFNQALDTYKLRDNILLAGVRTDIRRLLSSVDISLHPSYAETYGQSVVEAMAVGKATIATNAGGLPEVIQHGVDGYLVAPDSEAIREALEKLLSDPVERDRLARNARTRAVEQFSLSGMISAYQQLYQDTALSLTLSR